MEPHRRLDRWFRQGTEETDDHISTPHCRLDRPFGRLWARLLFFKSADVASRDPAAGPTSKAASGPHSASTFSVALDKSTRSPLASAAALALRPRWVLCDHLYRLAEPDANAKDAIELEVTVDGLWRSSGARE